MKVSHVLILLLFICGIAQTQIRHEQSGSSALGSLTVTATVTPSVWLVMEPDGKRDLVVANAPDPKDSFSHAPATKAGRKSALPATKHISSAAISRESLRNQNDPAVQFNFPNASKQFEVTRKTVMMDVSEGGKTGARPVTVTTIVAQ